VRRDSAKHSVSAETVYTVSVPVSFSAETEKVSFGRPLLDYGVVQHLRSVNIREMIRPRTRVLKEL
jgi:hypothetical protein